MGYYVIPDYVFTCTPSRRDDHVNQNFFDVSREIGVAVRENHHSNLPNVTDVILGTPAFSIPKYL